MLEQLELKGHTDIVIATKSQKIHKNPFEILCLFCGF
jgi:hypothetical protein